MKMEEHFKETLNRAIANEPPLLDAWDRFEQRAGRGRRVRFFAAFAAAAAVAVASVIVVPNLGTGDGVGLQNPPSESPSPSPTPSVDPYAGWKTFPYELYDLVLRYPEDWKVQIFEADPEVLAPGQKGTPEGGETMAVSITLRDEPFDSPEIREQGFDRSTRSDGRAFVWNERRFEGRSFVEYRIDWSLECVPPSLPTPPPPSFDPCARSPRTLIVTIHIGNDALGRQYREIAERIVTSMNFTGAPRQ